MVWLGTGENNNQRSVGFGDGIYKSTDAGATWTRMGLENSEHIQNILIDPRDSNVVYVSAIGPLWNAGGDRGLYKTIDGGKTWRAVLTISPDTGVTDVAMDPKNPNVLYAAAYQRRRAVGQLIGGGPESGLYKTTDGGGKWTKLSKGLPTVDIGRIGIGINWKNTQTVYALVTAQRGQGGFFRSDDAGASWTRIGRSAPGGGRGAGAGGGRAGATPPTPPAPCGPIGNVAAAPATPPAAEGPSAAAPQGGGRGAAPADDCYRGGDPGYYNEIFVDGHDPETIWSPQTLMWRSTDGGRMWSSVPMNVHVDHHEIVFDPTDKNHLLIGNDGGLYQTYDGMKTWRHFTNLPLSQFYRVSTDNARPFYNVCGGMQDNGSICGPSRTLNGRAGIRTSDWYSCQRRRRFLHGQRPRRSKHRLLRVAGGQLRPAGPAHWRAGQHPTAAEPVSDASGAHTDITGCRRRVRDSSGGTVALLRQAQGSPRPLRAGRCGRPRPGPRRPCGRLRARSRRRALALGHAHRHQPTLGAPHLCRRRPCVSQRRSW